MPTRQTYLLLGLAVLLVGAVALLWQQRAEIDGMKARTARAESESARSVAERIALEKSASEAREQAAALQKELAEARDTSAAQSVAKSREATPAPAADGKITADTVKQWLTDANDPAVMRRLNTQARNQTLRRYASLFTQLNLPAEQTELFTKLLNDKRQAPLDIVVSSLKDGTDPTKDMDEFRNQIIASRAEIENQIHALLGEANYTQYQSFDQNYGQANVLNNLQSALLGTAEPLTAQQAAQMTQLLQANNANRITAPVVNGAKDFLSLTQLQALQDLRALQLANSQKRLQPGQILPTAPMAPTGKP
jgi:hypothetical protein